MKFSPLNTTRQRRASTLLASGATLPREAVSNALIPFLHREPVVRQGGQDARPTLRAFTLIELILVMALITIVVSVSLPSLKGFFKGRDLDSEARRFFSLTRYAASRAVAEGIPMELYVDLQQKLYGLRAQAGFLESDSRAVQYKLPEELSFEVTAAPAKKISGQANFDDPEAEFTPLTEEATSSNPVKILRFTSDGFIGDKSPAAVILRQRAADELTEGHAIAIAQSATRLNYEIRTLQPQR